MVASFNLEDIDDPRQRRLYDHWRVACGGRAMPARADIDPLSIGWALGWVSIIDVEADGGFRWRLDGSRLAEFFRVDMTGKRLEAYPYPKGVAKLAADFAAVVAQGAPIFARRRYVDEDQAWAYRNLMLPLSAGGEAVGSILQMIVVDRA
jgi:hypothetical protein